MNSIGSWLAENGSELATDGRHNKPSFLSCLIKCNLNFSRLLRSLKVTRGDFKRAQGAAEIQAAVSGAKDEKCD